MALAGGLARLVGDRLCTLGHWQLAMTPAEHSGFHASPRSSASPVSTKFPRSTAPTRLGRRSALFVQATLGRRLFQRLTAERSLKANLRCVEFPGHRGLSPLEEVDSCQNQGIPNRRNLSRCAWLSSKTSCRR